MMVSLSPDSVRGALSRVDWSFQGSGTVEATVHSLHWFPGNFIPQIPRYLIQILSRPGDRVLDPFCGSGTTGVEAMLLQRRPIQLDALRASVQVATGKMAVLVADSLVKLRRLCAHLLLGSFLRGSSSVAGEGAHPELQHWFHPDTLAQLRYVWDQILRCEDRTARSVLELLFANTLFQCASTKLQRTKSGKARRHHWGWIADNVRPDKLYPHEAVRLFREQLMEAIEINARSPLIGHEWVVPRCGRAERLDEPSSSVDLIVTSPPYIGVIDYALANRLTYYWMNWSIESDRVVEIGARRNRNRLDAVDAYMSSLREAIHEMKRVLRPGGYCAMVWGSSRKHPHVARIVAEAISVELQPVWGPVKRYPSRRRVSERNATRFEECVAVFRKRA